MAHIDLSDYLADDTLTLHGIPSVAHPAAEGGGSYVIPSLSAEDGALLEQITELTDDSPMPTGDSPAAVKERTARIAKQAELVDLLKRFLRDADGNEISYPDKMLGSAKALMIADGISLSRLDIIVKLATIQAQAGTDRLERFVARAPGEAPALSNRAERRSAARKTASGTSRAATSKSSPASSGSGTRATRTATSSSTPSTSASRKPRKAG